MAAYDLRASGAPSPLTGPGNAIVINTPTEPWALKDNPDDAPQHSP